VVQKFAAAEGETNSINQACTKVRFHVQDPESHNIALLLFFHNPSLFIVIIIIYSARYPVFLYLHPLLSSSPQPGRPVGFASFPLLCVSPLPHILSPWLLYHTHNIRIFIYIYIYMYIYMYKNALYIQPPLVSFACVARASSSWLVGWLAVYRTAAQLRRCRRGGFRNSETAL
jgi:hypothetical protein